MSLASIQARLTRCHIRTGTRLNRGLRRATLTRYINHHMIRYITRYI
jgi:hypothetical protein